ncbi:MAG: Hpt domain-containing protein [Lachnospiraceae bacterium]|nr:Hpt domain-containing protein [Lachnospiraceae bacterium]
MAVEEPGICGRVREFMSDEMKRMLVLAGINIEALMGRIGQNEKLLCRLLGRFMEDENYKKLAEAMKTGDREAALMASHTLKGMTGNLSMDQLYQIVTRQVCAMRAENWLEAELAMGEITAWYEKIQNGIHAALTAGGGQNL